MRAAVLLPILLLAAALAGCSNSSDPGESLDYPDIPDLVVFYPFDGDLENAVANEHHGTSGRALTYVDDHNGTPNGAVHVVTDTILVADHPDLDITGEITMAAWIKPDRSGHSYACFLDKNYLESYSMGLHGASEPEDVQMRAYITDNHFWTTDIVPMGLDVWTHMAFTFDEATGKGKFYMNGSIVDSVTHATTIGVSDTDLRIGVAYYGDRYKGAVDQLAIFERALGPSEIEDLYLFD